MKYTEIKNLESSELRKRLVSTKQALFSARMQHQMKRLSNMMKIRHLRRDIARLEFALSLKPVVRLPAAKPKAAQAAPKQVFKRQKKQVDKKTSKLRDSKIITKQLASKPVKKTMQKLKDVSPALSTVATSATQAQSLKEKISSLFTWGKKDKKATKKAQLK